MPTQNRGESLDQANQLTGWWKIQRLSLRGTPLLLGARYPNRHRQLGIFSRRRFPIWNYPDIFTETAPPFRKTAPLGLHRIGLGGAGAVPYLCGSTKLNGQLES